MSVAEINQSWSKSMATDTSNSQQQQRGLVRASGSPLGMMLVPGDLFRMTPFSLMRRMTEEMDRVFGEFGLSHGENKAVWSPPIDVSKRDGVYVVRAELPGVDSGDVKLEVTADTVVLQGERKVERDETQGGVHLTERMYGRFYRAIPLPEGAKVDEAKAKFEKGVLEITVPLEEPRNQTREIPIEASSPATSPQTANTKAA
jgi:HSP20 family protein